MSGHLSQVPLAAIPFDSKAEVSFKDYNIFRITSKACATNPISAWVPM